MDVNHSLGTDQSKWTMCLRGRPAASHTRAVGALGHPKNHTSEHLVQQSCKSGAHATSRPFAVASQCVSLQHDSLTANPDWSDFCFKHLTTYTLLAQVAITFGYAHDVWSTTPRELEDINIKFGHRSRGRQREGATGWLDSLALKSSTNFSLSSGFMAAL